MIALPERLADGIAALTDGIDLRSAARAMSEAYRDGRPTVVTSEREAVAYAAYRMPATFAATVAALRAVRGALPGLVPTTLVDVGAGPGTAMWAACDVFPSIESAVLVESNAHMRKVCDRLASGLDVTWADTTSADADLVVASYSVGEDTLDIEELWKRAVDALVVVEPGTPRGFASVIDARTKLLEHGGHVVAPCPHDDPCPMRTPAWCHFAVRLPRSATHRSVKDAELPYEDEKYSYVAVTRRDVLDRAPRVIDHPHYRKHRVSLSLCSPDGLRKREVPRSDEGYRAARRVAWGDAFPD